MVVFTGKYFNSKGEVPATLYGMCSSGWMDQELFADWFLHHFLEYAVTSRPLMLLLDGHGHHSLHYTLELVKLAAKHHVVIFCLPQIPQLIVSHLIPHASSHLNLDVCCKYLFAHPSQVITKLMQSVWKCVIMPMFV